MAAQPCWQAVAQSTASQNASLCAMTMSMASRRVASSAEATSNNSIQSRTIARAIEASSVPFLVVTWKNSARA